jgi:hypothetical protein
MSVVYRQSYSIYYKYGSVYSNTLSADTRKTLSELRHKLLDSFDGDELVEGVDFESVEQHIIKPCGGEQRFKLVKKVTNKYWRNGASRETIL